LLESVDEPVLNEGAVGRMEARAQGGVQGDVQEVLSQEGGVLDISCSV